MPAEQQSARFSLAPQTRHKLLQVQLLLELPELLVQYHLEIQPTPHSPVSNQRTQSPDSGCIARAPSSVT